MLTFHKILIKLRNDLGFPEHNAGVCALYAEKAIDAFLIGEYHVFVKRCHYIREHYEELPALFIQAQEMVMARAKAKQSFFPPEKADTYKATSYTKPDLFISKEDCQMIFDVVAFIEQGELYQHPERYSRVFGKSLNQSHTLEISRYAQSVALEKMDPKENLEGRACLASLAGVYSRIELIEFMKQLNQLAKSAPQDFALSLGSADHRISLCYSHDEKNWLLVNANQYPLSPIPQYPISPIPDNDEMITALADDLLIAFNNEAEGVTAFSTQLFTTVNHQTVMQEQVDAWRKTKDLTDLHEINLAYASRKTEQGITLAWLAARQGDSAVLKQITQLGSADVLNQADIQGVTPAYIAAQNGHSDALRVLMEAKTPEGDLLVNLNKANKNGATPAWMAAKNGNSEALRVLMEAKTPEGKLIVDLNKANKDGDTPASIAAYNGNSDVLRVLMEAKTPEGELVVDLNNEGCTPALMAAKNGHADSLRVLMEAKTSDGKRVVDFNKANKNGVAPIHLAIYNGYLNIVHLLLEANVDLTCLFYGISPLQLAEKMGRKDIADVLREAQQASPDPSLKP